MYRLPVGTVSVEREHRDRAAGGVPAPGPLEDAMKTNIGRIERIVRIVVGLGILSLAFVGPRSPWAYLGILPVITGLVGWCPPYTLLGISTVKAPK